jgi:hypothetical protein
MADCPREKVSSQQLGVISVMRQWAERKSSVQLGLVAIKNYVIGPVGRVGQFRTLQKSK